MRIKPNHTPGPWKVWEPETENGRAGQPAKTIVIAKHQRDYMAQELAYVNCESSYFKGAERVPVPSQLHTEPYWPTAPAEAMANARLIAAAPDLVKACRGVKAALIAFGPTADGTPEGDALEAWITKLSRVLAKATGSAK